ncbi:hypothetical protein CAOG_06771 [Capsaspora owczarzaki ATCC 30864]|uniref:PH domain-containing protein n=1 Tax=Capsaspora owczarzaki (strain ATCC 30864) TaxID=595528 RepID=A0A0D2UN40_CAPO3|nr:hypothetical protein CAOG_06771 [Capsaspora owczarzaki ATCC 30864]KJE96446.1 hypothetical protein CAOG_006771 [Capsaspora owczarzaki ATCC 30864]|eukprot:XP_004344392.1 hypothetical protein CAOG_06771 [Capsaspora owczarzaki ATCC 30864]
MSVAAGLPSPNHVQRGYLYKEGGSIVSSRWQRRWFALESNETAISYWKSSAATAEAAPLGTIYIEDVVAVTDLSATGDKRVLLSSGAAASSGGAAGSNAAATTGSATAAATTTTTTTTTTGSAATATATAAAAGSTATLAPRAGPTTPNASFTSSSSVAGLPSEAQFPFKITCVNRDYVLAAETAEDKNEWVRVLREVCLTKAEMFPVAGGASRAGFDPPHFVTAECFVTRGVRIHGRVPISLLGALAPGLHPDKKRRDERGWFADIHVPVARLVNIFVGFGFQLTTLFATESINSLDPTGPTVPSTIAVFTMPQQRARGFTVVASTPMKRPPPPSVAPTTANASTPPPKPAPIGAQRLPPASPVALKATPAPVARPPPPAQSRPTKPVPPGSAPLSPSPTAAAATSPAAALAAAAAANTRPVVKPERPPAALASNRMSTTFQLTDLIDEELESLMRKFEMSADFV